MKSSSAFFPLLLLAIAMISVQTGAAFAKTLFPEIGAYGASTLRIGIAAVLMLFAFRPWRFHVSLLELKTICAYGVVLGGMNLLFYAALSRIPLGIAVAIEFFGPLGVGIISSRSAKDFLWALLAVIGLSLILPFRDLSSLLASPMAAPVDPVGVIYALGAGMCWALYILLGHRASKTIPAGVAASLGMTVAALLALPFGVFTAGVKLLSPHLLPVGILVALLSSALPYSLEMFALKRVAPKKFGILMSMEPALAALSGLLLLGEHLTITQWSAILCIILASFGVAVTPN